jgi:peptidoglycan/xylan/chitin deacetylase (PgdA/CDA1 family)
LSPAERSQAVEAAAWPDAERQMLRREDLPALAPMGVQLGAHGHTHAPLTHCEDPAGELRRSRDFLRQVGGGIPAMAFPHGAWSPKLVADARSLGFAFVFSSEPQLTSVAGSGSLPPCVGRVGVPENEWTCRSGEISYAKLATYLFFRQTSSSAV